MKIDNNNNTSMLNFNLMETPKHEHHHFIEKLNPLNATSGSNKPQSVNLRLSSLNRSPIKGGLYSEQHSFRQDDSIIKQTSLNQTISKNHHSRQKIKLVSNSKHKMKSTSSTKKGSRYTVTIKKELPLVIKDSNLN